MAYEEETTAAATDAADEQPVSSQPTLFLHFMDLAGDPLPDLIVRVTVWRQATTYVTDATGNLPEITARPDAQLHIEVQRFDGSFKTIEECLMPASSSTWNYLSPQLVLEAETQLHEGKPGTMEDHVPTPTATDEGEKPKEQVQEADEQGAVSPATDSVAAEPVVVSAPAPKPSGPAVVAAPKPRPKPQPLKPAAASAKPAVPQITGAPVNPVRDAKPEIGRNANGNPLAVFGQKVKDWWNSWSLPTLEIWHPSSGAGSASSAPANNKQTGSKVPYQPSMLPKVKALIEFAQEQTTYKYSDSEGTAAVVAAMVKKTFNHVAGEKDSSKSLGKCYQYVRIALTRAQIVEDGYLAKDMELSCQESASNAGEPLKKKGFVDVTEEVPDARWAAAGDVIVYQWSAETWEARKKKKNNSKLPNHGHIDIRCEETYISDFMPQQKHPSWTVENSAQKSPKFHPEYVRIRIYRKVYDPTPTCRIRAFLACLREFECQAIKNDSDRYTALNTPLPNAPKLRKFSGFEKHPWDAVPKEKWPASTAAGAYQITCTTWREEMERRYFADVEDMPVLFTPNLQDRMAVRRLEFRNALHPLRAGNLEAAVSAARGEWTSLPGAKENSERRTMDGKPMNMVYFKALYEKFLALELGKFGIGVE